MLNFVIVTVVTFYWMVDHSEFQFMFSECLFFNLLEADTWILVVHELN
jgi:hypothetical protein